MLKEQRAADMHVQLPVEGLVHGRIGVVVELPVDVSEPLAAGLRRSGPDGQLEALEAAHRPCHRARVRQVAAGRLAIQPQDHRGVVPP